MTRIGDFDSFDFFSESAPFQEKLQKIEKTEEDPREDKENLYHPFPEEKVAKHLPAFLQPHPSRGPAEISLFRSNARPANMAIPPNPPEGLEFFADKIIATPPKFPPPTLDPPISKPETHQAKELPQSDYFWQDFDMPDEPPPRRQFEEAEGPNQIPAWKRRAEFVPSHRGAKKKLDSQQELLAAVARPKEEKEEREGKTTPFFVPDPLPPQFAAIAKKAEIGAAPYLNPATVALFFEIVGAISFIQKTAEGISRTEIVLNAEGFKESPFYNATIVIEQHETAPGSYNICLQGSPQAVQIFNSNLPSLESAFAAAYESRNIAFRIGRLEAALLPEWSASPRKKRSDSGQDDDQKEPEE